jgi:hypothetical protein
MDISRTIPSCFDMVISGKWVLRLAILFRISWIGIHFATKVWGRVRH